MEIFRQENPLVKVKKMSDVSDNQRRIDRMIHVMDFVSQIKKDVRPIVTACVSISKLGFTSFAIVWIFNRMKSSAIERARLINRTQSFGIKKRTRGIQINALISKVFFNSCF